LKKLSVVLITAAILCLLLGTTALTGEAPEYPVELEGQQIDGQAFVSDGDLYLPVRAVCGLLGYEVKWHPKERKIQLNKDKDVIEISLEDFKVDANGYETYLTSEHKLVDGRIFLEEDFFQDILRLRVYKENDIVAVSRIEENPITIKNEEYFWESDDIMITLKYPQICGLEDQTIQDNLNAVFRSAAEEAKTEGLRNAEEMRKERASAEEAGYPFTPNRCETYFDYAVKYNQNGLLSVVLRNYQYTGGAHGLTVHTSRTFDLATGKEYRLKDLFTEGTDYVSLISEEVKKSMEKQGMTDLLLNPFDAIAPDEDFYLADNGLAVYFQAYEYFPYAAGIPEFEVDYSALRDGFVPGLEFLK